MCGIAGILRTDGGILDVAWGDVLPGAEKVLHHRGPDGRGRMNSGYCSLVHTRLSIIDLTESGRQPMSNEDGTVWLVFNGEIYNYQNLRLDLERNHHIFKSNTDSEVILHLWEDMGPACLQRLDGMFAFAIWDSTERVLFIARDRLGVKPLTYQIDQHALRFASEAKAILADPGVPREPNLQAISYYLTFGYVPAPMSAFRGFHQLPPAHYLVVRDGKVGDPVRYWNYDRKAKRTPDTAEVRDVLLRQTARRLIADVPIGVLLSGGIDSSAVTWAMRELGHKPTTFCMAFEDPALDERHAARIVARHLGTEHHEFEAPCDPAAVLPRLVEHYDEPFADSSAVPTFLLAEQVSKHVKVVLTGDGGDEAFGGYQRYVYQRNACRFMGPEWEMYRVPFCMFHGKRWEEITTPEFRKEAWTDGMPFLACRFQDSTGIDSTDRAMDVDTRLYLPDDLCVKMDRATMAFGLEARSPFLDHRLVEFAATIPSGEKVRWGFTKRILKKALDGKLPREILNRPKQGFGAPVSEWLRGPLREPLVAHTYELCDRGWINSFAMGEMVGQHLTGKANHATPLWYLLMLELWARRWIDR